MRASQSVFLTEDRKDAVAEGDPRARFLLVREGLEIAEGVAQKYTGAIELIGGTKAAPKASGVESREPSVEHRDPPKKGGRHGSKP